MAVQAVVHGQSSAHGGHEWRVPVVRGQVDTH